MSDPDIMDEYDEFSELPETDAPDPPPPEGIIPLGYDRGVYYYYSQSARQIVPLTASNHSKYNLAGIASIAHYWERSSFTTEKGAIKWDEAIDWLMTSCRAVGIFDPDRIRGRGAWLDNGRAVLHVGNRLIVDGEPRPLMLAGSRHIYEAAKPLNTVYSIPLTAREANRLVEICSGLRWEKGIHGTLLAGFIAVAPICGGLQWRPSIWLTGGSGSGKSYVNENILRPALAGIALQVLSKTSEAGIRQRLASDARPVLFDEAEKEDAAAAIRMQGVIDLVRQSSSESGAEIIKGSQNQTGAKSYRVRSSFAFSSINVGIEHQADDSRITVLSLRSPPTIPSADDAAKFESLNALVVSTITPEFASGLVARSVRLLTVIRANAETFARAVALHFGSRRMGDQLGALLAGAYSLYSDREITPQEAACYLARQEWQSTMQADDTERDERRLLTHLTQARVRFAPGNSAPIEIALGRLIEAAWGGDERIAPDTAEIELRASGVRTDGREGIFVSTNHPALKRMLTGTPWATGWSRALSRLPGADRLQKGMRFGPMHNSKAIWLSRKLLDGDEK